jgi:hypothetical protein
VLVIAQVLGHLRGQRGLEHVLGQLVEQPVRANRFDSLFLRLRLRLRQELLSELPLSSSNATGSSVLRWSVLPAKLTPGVSDQEQIHRCSDSPDNLR